jgi:hypothetical protein
VVRQHRRFCLAHRNRPPGSYNASPRDQLFAAGWREKVQLELDGEDADAFRHQTEGRVPARAIQRTRQHTGVEEPMLLRQFRLEGQSDFDLTGEDALESCADRRHDSLRCETIANNLLEVWVTWFNHS